MCKIKMIPVLYQLRLGDGTKKIGIGNVTDERELVFFIKEKLILSTLREMIKIRLL